MSNVKGARELGEGLRRSNPVLLEVIVAFSLQLDDIRVIGHMLYLLEIIDRQIEVNPPSNGWLMGEITMSNEFDRGSLNKPNDKQ